MAKTNWGSYRRINEGAQKYPEIYSEKSDFMMKEEFIKGTVLLKMYNAVPQAARQIFDNNEAVAFFKMKYPQLLEVLKDLVSVFNREVETTDNLKKYSSYYDALLDVETAYLEYVDNVALRFELREPLLTEDTVTRLENNAGLLSSGLRDYEKGFVGCLDMIAEGKLDVDTIINR